MNMPLLKTKLYIPAARSRLVPRPRLIERLDEGVRSAKLTLISAPAGFGKTTLLSEWIHGRGTDVASAVTPPLQVAWLSLDAGDNDPTRFWAYVVAALQTVFFDGQADMLGQVDLALRMVPIMSTFLKDFPVESHQRHA